MAINEITDAEFDNTILKSSTPAVVDFWATWCGPCRALEPIYKDVATKYENQNIKFFKMNVDDNPNIPSRYGVRGIPTLILFKDGQPVNQIVGVVPKSDIEELVNKAL